VKKVGLFKKYYKSSKKKVEMYGGKVGGDSIIWVIDFQINGFEDLIKKYPHAEKMYSKQITKLKLEKEKLEIEYYENLLNQYKTYTPYFKEPINQIESKLRELYEKKKKRLELPIKD
jgi:hypothetical protein